MPELARKKTKTKSRSKTHKSVKKRVASNDSKEYYEREAKKLGITLSVKGKKRTKSGLQSAISRKKPGHLQTLKKKTGNKKKKTYKKKKSTTKKKKKTTKKKK